MLIIMNIDWFGTPEGFEKYKKDWQKACKETKGIKSTKLYTSHQARYHYSWVTEADSYEAFMSTNRAMPPRNRKDLTHVNVEVFTEVT
jgi:hypothetical protein